MFLKAHDEVGDDGLGVVGGAAQHDAAAGIGMAGQDVGQVLDLHKAPPKNVLKQQKGRTSSLTKCAQTVGIS